MMESGVIARNFLIPGCMFLAFFTSAPAFADEAQAVGPKTLHGNAWAFGRSADREAPIWIKGIDAHDISKKARPKAPSRNAADTSNGIDAALSRAQKKSGGNLDLRMKNETSRWKTSPIQNEMRQDEDIAMDGKHVLGAYAGLEAAEDLKINIGPELIIKDEQNVRESSNASQPDTALGLGMNFTLDF